MSDININLPAPLSSYEQEVVYKECMRNHAASLGRVAYDGCLEFLEGGLRPDDNTRDELLCAACGCHRSFHRKITIYTPITQTNEPNSSNNNNVNGTVSPPSGFRVQELEAQPETKALAMPYPMPMPVAAAPPVRPRKKRTSFTAEQKRRLMGFAERVGWKPKKADKEVVNNFCMEMGISRRMFVVWLSNNRRHAMPQNNGATDPTPSPATPTATATGTDRTSQPWR